MDNLSKINLRNYLKSFIEIIYNLSLELKGRDPNLTQRTLSQHEHKDTATGVKKWRYNDI